MSATISQGNVFQGEINKRKQGISILIFARADRQAKKNPV